MIKLLYLLTGVLLTQAVFQGNLLIRGYIEDQGGTVNGTGGTVNGTGLILTAWARTASLPSCPVLLVPSNGERTALGINHATPRTAE